MVTIKTTNLQKTMSELMTRLESALQKEQQLAGRRWTNQMKLDAINIINRKKAAHTTGELTDSIIVQQEKISDGMKYRITTTSPYALRVHSGFAPYVETKIDSRLLSWVKNNLGPTFADRVRETGSMKIGYPSGKRKYDAQLGMRFFDDAVENFQQSAQTRYREMVDRAVVRSRL